MDHVDEHLLIHLVYGGGADDAVDLLDALEELPRGSLVAELTQTVGQTLDNVHCSVLALPQVEELQNVLLGLTGVDHCPHVVLAHSDPRQTLHHRHQILQSQVLQARTPGHLPLTVVYTWTA